MTPHDPAACRDGDHYGQCSGVTVTDERHYCTDYELCPDCWLCAGGCCQGHPPAAQQHQAGPGLAGVTAPRARPPWHQRRKPAAYGGVAGR
jgi:hypothetical protein